MRRAVEPHRQRAAADRAGGLLLDEPPLARHAGGPAAQQVAVVDVAEGLARIENAEPDVARPVADAEHPAVAGQQPPLLRRPIPQFEPRLEPVVVVARAAVVAADGDTHGPVLALAQPEGEGEPAGVAVGADDDRGAVRRRPAVLSGRNDADDPAGALVEDRVADGRALLQGRAGLLGLAGEDLVEVGPRPDEPVVGEARELGPGELEPHAAAVDPQAVVAEPTCLGADVDTHREQRPDGARGEAVAANLLARERRLLEEAYVEAGLRQVVGGGRAGGSGTDDDHVTLDDGGRCGHVASSGLVNGFTSGPGQSSEAPIESPCGG